MEVGENAPRLSICTSVLVSATPARTSPDCSCCRRAARLRGDSHQARLAPGGEFPVKECLRIVLKEDWEHRLYAERDLTSLENVI